MILQITDTMQSMLERVANAEWLSEHLIEIVALFGSLSVGLLYSCRNLLFDVLGIHVTGPRHFRDAVQHHCQLRHWKNEKRYVMFVSERTDVDIDTAQELISSVDRDQIAALLGNPTHYRDVIINERIYLNQEIFAVANNLISSESDLKVAQQKGGHELFTFLVYDDLAIELEKSWSKTLRGKAVQWQERRAEILDQIVGRFPETNADSTTSISGQKLDKSSDQNPEPTQIINALNIGYLEHFQGRQKLLASVLADVANPRNTLISVIGRGGIGKSLLAEKAFDTIQRRSTVDLSHIICFDSNVRVEVVYHRLRDLISRSDKARFTRAYKKAVSTTNYRDLLVAFAEISLPLGLSILLYFDEFEEMLKPVESRASEFGFESDSEKIVAMISGCLASHPPNLKILLTSRTHIQEFRREVPPVHSSYSLDEPLTVDEIRNLFLSLDRDNRFDFSRFDINDFSLFCQRIGGTPRCVRNTYSALSKDPLLKFDEIISGNQLPGEISEDVVDRHLAEALSPIEQDIRFVIACLQDVFRTPVPVEIVSDSASCTTEEFATSVRRMSDYSLISVKSSSIGNTSLRTCSMHPLDRQFCRENIYRLVGQTEGEFCRPVFHQAAQSIDELIGQLELPENDLTSIDLRRTQFNLLWRSGYRDRAIDSLNRTNEVMFATGLYGQVVESNLEVYGCEEETFENRIRACNHVSKSLNWSGKLNDSLRYSERSVAMCESIRDPNLRSESLALRADCHNELAKSRLALRDSHLAYGLAQQTSNLPAMAFAIFHSARAQRGLGDIHDSIRCFQECLALEEQVNNSEDVNRKRNLGWVKRNLAQSFLQNGDILSAKDLFFESAKLHREDNNKGDLSLTLVRIARLNLTEGNLESVVGLCEEALELSNETTLLQTLVEARQTLVLAYLASAHPRSEVFSLLDDLENYSYPRFDQFTTMLRAIAFCMDGDTVSARQLFLSSIDHCDKLLEETPGYIYAVSCRTICQACMLMISGDNASEFWESLRTVSESNLGIGIRRFVLATLHLMEGYDRFGILPDIQNQLTKDYP